VSDLVAFLTARLDEDEATANAATPAPWVETGEDILSASDDPHWTSACAANASGADARHIARWDPVRVLREVEAKRRILKLHAREHHCPISIPTETPERFPEGEYISTEYVDDSEACTTVRALAAVYAGHPDYDEAWK